MVTLETMIAAELTPPRTFDAACRMVVDYLAEVVPLDAWAVTRVASGQQTVLVSTDTTYGLVPGTTGAWSASICQYMTAGTTPRVVPDAAGVPALADVVANAAEMSIPVGAYVGTPIVRPDGHLFGTLIGLDPRPKPEAFLEHESLLDLLSSLLSSVLEADTAATDSARALEHAVSESETDALTGLLNRRGWNRWLAREEDRFRRFGDPASVVMFDLDGLKQVNDTEGHDAGDALIRRTAEALRSATRSGDPLARLGGDEFGLIAPLGADDATLLVTRLRAVLDGAEVSCSIGVAPFGVATGFDGAIAEADTAMYADKRARRVGR